MWKRLDNYFKSANGKIDANKYFEICEQLGEEPDPDKIPVEIEDLPDIVKEALYAFNMLGDRIQAEVGYLGKDYSNLREIMNTQFIEDEQLYLQILNWLDSRAIEKSADTMKREHEKLKRKRKGG
jgi:hypothetical protein|tara:strand:- start:3667 stop:4041 length:375 start_codon:yes stop_codon:yes gene_type:complete